MELVARRQKKVCREDLELDSIGAAVGRVVDHLEGPFNAPVVGAGHLGQDERRFAPGDPSAANGDASRRVGCETVHRALRIAAFWWMRVTA